MASPFTAIKVSGKLSKAISLAPTSDDVVAQIRPPIENKGIDETTELFKSLFIREIVPHILRPNTNNSPVCGMEIWYHNEEVKFMLYVPSTELAKHYRRQFSGHFPGLSIEDVWEDTNKFPHIPKDDYLSAIQLQLKNHYFEPIRSPASDTTSFDTDPYQTILSEIDTKDEDVKTVIQFLFKPAEDDWTELHTNNVETYSTRLQNGGGYKSRYFGLLIDEVETPKARAKAAKQIRKQVNKPAYYVNVRIAVASSERAKTEEQVRSVFTDFENEYLEATKQTFTTKNYWFSHESRMKETILNMALRQETFMEQPKSPFKWMRNKLGNCDTMIMTIPELSGLIHIPNGDELNVDSISWTNAPVSGTLPPEAKNFKPTTKKEREVARERLKKRKKGTALRRYKSSVPKDNKKRV